MDNILDDRINVGRTEDEYFENLRDLIIYCICRDLSKGLTTFHGVDMVKRCAKGFLDEQGVDQYQFSGEHEYYKHVLERIYRPLVDFGLLVEYENNNFGVHNNRLHDICRKELDGKGCIKWDGFLRTELSEIQ